MYFHILKYQILRLLHSRELLAWTLAFPLLLGTFFYLSFGNMMNNDKFKFNPIPIALVSEEEDNVSLNSVVEELGEDGENQLFIVSKATRQEAVDMLEANKIEGIIFSKPVPEVMVSKNGTEQSILKSFVEQYLQHQNIYTQVAQSHPEQISHIQTLLSENIRYNEEISFSNTNMSDLSQYFYALIAMTCLYGSITGRRCVEKIQANLSALGARRCVAPTHKLSVILGDFTGAVMLCYLSVVILFLYLTLILKIDFGNRIGYILLTSLFGSIIGVSMGTFIGSMNRIPLHVKEALVLSLTMLCSFLSGLMINSMKIIVEHHFPLLNRINPAALITDSLYSLNMYSTYTRFYKDIAMMGVIAVLLCFGSYLMLRRNRYASI